MPTKKVIDMTARSSSSLAYNDFLYLTKEAPLTDEKVQASTVRDFVLSGVKTSSNSGLAQTSSSYASSNPEYELSLDVNNLAVVTPVAGDYISIEDVTDNSTKKVLVSAVVGLASGTVTSVTGGTNLTASPTTGATVVNLDATLTGLTSVTSTDFAGALTGNVTGNLTGNVTGNVTGDVTGDVPGDLTGTASVATALASTLGVTAGGTGLTTAAKGSVLVVNAADTISAEAGVTNGHVLTYDSASDTVGWAAPGHATGTVTSVAISGTDGIDVDSGSPITTSGTITLGLSGIGDAAISSAATWNAKQNALTFGIANTNSVVIDSASVADNDYAKFTASGLEGRTASETKTDLSLDNVENTALSTWAGSTNVTTLGTIATGTWQGTDIAAGYIADTVVTPGSYTNTSITVDQQGRLTAASSGATPPGAGFTIAMAIAL